MIKYYYAIDGDDIGTKLENFVLLDDMKGVKELSQNVDDLLVNLEIYFKSNGASIIFSGGDSLLAVSEQPIEISVNEINIDKISFSVGIATSPSLALLALKKAKGLGKNRVESFIGNSL